MKTYEEKVVLGDVLRKKWVFIHLGTGERKMGYSNCSIKEEK